MKKNFQHLPLLLLFLVAGCSPRNASPKKTTTPTISVELSSTTPTKSLTRTITPSVLIRPTSIATLLAGQGLNQYICEPILTNLPLNAKITGTLILDGQNGSSFLNIESSKRRELDTTASGYRGFSVSPNGKHVAYIQFVNDSSSTNEWLVIDGVNGQQEAKIPVKEGWDFGSWLDNDRLVFSPFRDWQQAPPVIVVNPFTNQHQELQSNYPGLKTWRGAGGDPYTFFGPSSSVVYDPSLNLAVYFQTDENFQQHTVLWDRKAGKTLAIIRNDPYTPAPLWAPDRKAFYLVAYSAERQDGHGFYDWFRMSAEGQIQRLTHFGDSLTDIVIGGSSLSPNNRYLAFWLNTAESYRADGGQDGQYQHLAILDLETNEVSAYCLPEATPIETSPPVWSPDSQYVAVTPWLDDSNQPVIVLNIQDGWMAKVAENIFVRGWMDRSPTATPTP